MSGPVEDPSKMKSQKKVSPIFLPLTALSAPEKYYA